jgi:hypothetical protein
MNSPKRKSHAWQGMGSFQSSDAGQCTHPHTTPNQKTEAAIIALRAGVETLYRLEERKRPLFEIAEGLDTTIYRVFERREYRARGERVPPRRRVDADGLGTRLSRASRLRVAAEMDRLIDAAEAAGLDEKAISDELYAPIMAAEEKEQARRARRAEAAARLVAAWNAAVMEAAAIDASPDATPAAAVSAARRCRLAKAGEHANG